MSEHWDQKLIFFNLFFFYVQEEVERGDSGFCLPYDMEKGKIVDKATGNSYSVKMQFNSEEQWTKAMKYMLTNLKWGLAWVTSKYPSKATS